jgi:prepilin-type processing-associated H-X9-DG protein
VRSACPPYAFNYSDTHTKRQGKEDSAESVPSRHGGSLANFTFVDRSFLLLLTSLLSTTSHIDLAAKDVSRGSAVSPYRLIMGSPSTASTTQGFGDAPPKTAAQQGGGRGGRGGRGGGGSTMQYLPPQVFRRMTISSTGFSEQTNVSVCGMVVLQPRARV